LLARSPEVTVNFGTPISLGWLGQVFDLRTLVARQLDLPLCRFKLVMNGVPLDDEMLLSELGLDTVKDLVVERVQRPICRVYVAVPRRIVVDVDSETTVGRLHEFCRQIPERMSLGIDGRTRVDSLDCHPRRPLCFRETSQLKVVFNEAEFKPVVRGETEMIEIMKAMAAQLGKGHFAVFCDDVEVSDFATVAGLGYPRRLEIKRVENLAYKFCFKQKIYRLFLVPHAATVTEARNELAKILKVFPSLIAISPDGGLELGIEHSVTIPDCLCSCDFSLAVSGQSQTVFERSVSFDERQQLTVKDLLDGLGHELKQPIDRQVQLYLMPKNARVSGRFVVRPGAKFAIVAPQGEPDYTFRLYPEGLDIDGPDLASGVYGKETVNSVKERLCRHWGLRTECHLRFWGVPLDDDAIFMDYHIPTGSLLSLVARPYSPKSNPASSSPQPVCRQNYSTNKILFLAFLDSVNSEPIRLRLRPRLPVSCVPEKVFRILNRPTPANMIVFRITWRSMKLSRMQSNECIGDRSWKSPGMILLKRRHSTSESPLPERAASVRCRIFRPPDLTHFESRELAPDLRLSELGDRVFRIHPTTHEKEVELDPGKRVFDLRLNDNTCLLVERVASSVIAVGNAMRRPEFDLNDYTRRHFLGHGGCGDVHCYVHKTTGEKVAVKSIGGTDAAKVRREVEIIRRLRHPCVLDFVGIQSEGSVVWIATRLVEPGALDQLIRKGMLTNPTDQAKVVVGVALGMRFLHGQRVVHRDLKPANILVEKDMGVRICDFGLSKVADLEVSLTDNWGTAAYMAPEIAAAEKFSFPVDVFAFACTWYEIITGKLALLGGNILQLNRSAIEGTRNEIPAVWNPKLVSLLRRCWAPDQRERPTFNEIVSAFERERFALVSGVDQSEVQSYVNRILRMEGRAGQDD
jgi:hypothetical protein